MVDFENRYGDFAEWPTPRQRIPLIAALADSIHGNEAFGTAHSLHLQPLKAIMCPPDARMEHVKRFAYGMLLVGCLDNIMFMFKPPARERVRVICEECPGVEGFAARMFEDFQRRHNFGDRLDLTFMPKAAFRGLQAADLLAYEAFKHITNTLVREDQRPVRKLFTKLQSSRRLAVAYALEDDIKRWRRKYSEL